MREARKPGPSTSWTSGRMQSEMALIVCMEKGGTILRKREEKHERRKIVVFQNGLRWSKGKNLQLEGK